MPFTPTDRGVRLLKCLCQTEEEKAVAWHSDARSLERQRIPREFTTKVPRRHHLERLADAQQERGGAPGPRARAPFQPSAAEVHAQAGKWFDDEEIYGWFAANLHRVREPSLRHYVRAKELKAAGMDWTEVLAAEDENPRARLAAELWPAPPTTAPRRGSRRSWSRGEGAGRPSSTTGVIF